MTELMNELVLQASRARIVTNGQVVGYLDRIASDEYRFAYEANYLTSPTHVPLSLSLPISKKDHVFDQLPPFFDNLLMEGRVLRRMCKIYGLDPRVVNDRFKLLMLSALDTIGAVEILPLDKRGQVLSLHSKEKSKKSDYEYQSLQSAYESHCPVCMKPGSMHPSCANHLLMSKSEPKIAIDTSDYANTFRILPAGASISGAQDKNLFRAQRGRLTQDVPSTHIIKPEGDFAEMPANEHLTMTIAKRCGFPVPWVGLFRVPDFGLIYIIRRFDRNAKGERALLEDFAQILKYMEAEKDEGSMEEIALGIERYCSSPAIEKINFFKRVLFSFVFGNGDMHLKNWSLIYDQDSRLYVLSPAYDWLNVRASMPEEQVEMILPLGGKRSGFTRPDFEAFASNTLKIPFNLIAKSFTDLVEWTRIADELCSISALTNPMKKRYMGIVRERSKRML